jgi:serine/threonine protein phosphatase PrpC
MRLTWAAASDPGLRRLVNEDCYCARADLGLFVVADGMGGHAAGEVASRLAVEAIETVVDRARAEDRGDPFGTPAIDGREAWLLRDAFRTANRRIADEMVHRASVRGMATTASAVLFGVIPVVAHVGDSRVYLLRDGRLGRVTHDHSWVEEQVRAGVLDEIAARRHPWRSVVTRAINGGDDPDVDIVEVPMRPGDRLLLCSDGLSAVVPDERIGEVVAGAPALDDVCRQLVSLANEEGGPDNITVVILEAHAD